MRFVLVAVAALLVLPMGFSKPAEAAGKKYSSKSRHVVHPRGPRTSAQVRGFRARSIGGYSYIWVDSLSDEHDVAREAADPVDTRSLWERVQEEHTYP